jgi:diguanylate cyclase (GGDEF)-like protein/PAS domain S-box-containing protein
MSNQQQRVINLSETVGLVLSQDFAKLVLLNDMDVASDITAKLKSFDRLRSMVLYRATDSRAVYQYSKDETSFTPEPLATKEERVPTIKGDRAVIFIEAKYQDYNFGDIVFEFEVDTVYEVIKKNIKFLLIVALSLLLFSYLLSLYYAKKFTEPILKLLHFLEKIELSDSLNKRIHTDENNEFGKLYAEVNKMLSRLDSSRQAQKLAAVAFETQSGMTITDANREILRVNKAFTQITGYESDEVIGKTPAILSSGRHDDSFYKNMWESLEKNHYWSGEIWNRHKNGDVFPEHLTIQAVLDDNSKTIYYVAAFIDLTLQKEAQEKVEFLSSYDALTGLANKTMLTNSIQEHLDKGMQKRYGALICFDLNDFKSINDTYGYTHGDALLQEVASRLKRDFSHSDLLVRHSADEFIIWFSTLSKEIKESTLLVEKYAKKLLLALTEPYKINNNTINSIPSVGITIYSNKDTDAQKLIREAHVALHQTKTNPDKSIAFFDESFQKMAKEHMQLYTELLEAVKKEEFELLYQPQYNNEGEIYGVEALIRWNHPTKGIISPFGFIDVAEKTGLILPIGRWVLQSACKQLGAWQEKSTTKKWKIAINVSAREFNQEDFIDAIEDNIKKNNIDPQLLKLELTESLFIDNTDKVIEKMNKLKKLGIEISLDDFGTGYSSLQYLRKLPLDQVKIDKSFVQDMIESKNDEAIIKSVIYLGGIFGFEVIAEGVESKEQYEYLKKLGCFAFQGYYFSRPKPASEIVELKS